MALRKWCSNEFWVTLAGALIAALMLIGGSRAAPLAPGDDFQIVSSKFAGTTATFVIMNNGTTNLAVFQATFPVGTRVVGGSSSPSATTCAGGGSLPNAGACFFLDQAPWPPGSTRSIMFQLDAPGPAGKVVQLCASSQFGGSDVCKEVVPRAEKLCECSRLSLTFAPVRDLREFSYNATSLKGELKWQLECEGGGPGACAGGIIVSLKKHAVFPDARVRRPQLTVSCKGNCKAGEEGIHLVRSGALLFEIVAKQSLKPPNRKGRAIVVKLRAFCKGDKKPSDTADLRITFDKRKGDIKLVELKHL